MANVTVTKDRYTVDSLYQWDKDQDLIITGLSLASIPEIHFTNDAMDKAIVQQATMNEAGVITARIPNSLLQKPYKIRAYVGIYEGESFRSLYLITIPIQARSMPLDYKLTVGDDEVYSFNALENLINNTVVKLVAESEKICGEMVGEIKKSNEGFQEKLTEQYDGLDLKKASFYDSIDALKADEKLSVGMFAVTAGYYSSNDGGGGTYKIRDKKGSDTDDGGCIHVFADGLRVAELVTTNGIINVKQFGAKGDGNTDDSEAIQKAVNKSAWLESFKILIPTGVFICKNISIPQNAHITGNYRKSILKLPSNCETGDCIFYEPLDSYSNIVLENLELEGNKENFTNGAICDGIRNATNEVSSFKYNSIYRNLVIENFTGSGINLTQYVMEYTLDNVLSHNNDKDGCRFVNICDSRMLNSCFAGNGEYGVYIHGTTVKIANVKCYCNGILSKSAGMYLHGNGHNLSNVEIQENYYDGLILHGISHSMIGAVVDSNNNNDGCYQCVLESSYNNIINLVIRMHSFGDGHDISEKGGFLEKDYNNIGNSITLTYDVPLYFDQDPRLSISSISLLNDCHNISNTYNIAGYDFYNDDIETIDFSKVTISNKLSGCVNEILNNGKALKQICPINENITDGQVIGGIMLDALIDVSDIQSGDILQFVGLAKTSAEHLTKITSYIAEVRDGAWMSPTTLSQTLSTSNAFHRIHFFTELGGRENATDYKISVQILFQKNGNTAISESEIEMILKNFKYSIIRKNWV